VKVVGLPSRTGITWAAPEPRCRRPPAAQHFVTLRLTVALRRQGDLGFGVSQAGATPRPGRPVRPFMLPPPARPLARRAVLWSMSPRRNGPGDSSSAWPTSTTSSSGSSPSEAGRRLLSGSPQRGSSGGMAESPGGPSRPVAAATIDTRATLAACRTRRPRFSKASLTSRAVSSERQKRRVYTGHPRRLGAGQEVSITPRESRPAAQRTSEAPWQQDMPPETPAGWYPDPSGDGLRYWDGASWTPYTRLLRPRPRVDPRNPGEQVGPVGEVTAGTLHYRARDMLESLERRTRARAAPR